MLLGERPDSDVVLVDAESAAEVRVGDVRARAEELRSHRGALTLLVADGSTAAWTDCLALIESRSAVALLDPAIGREGILALARRYRPVAIVDPSQVVGTWRPQRGASETHLDLAVLLTTSGTTGSPRFVRLSAANVRVNAMQIAEALALDETERAIATLPLGYSFGLSVLTSHAVSGGSVAVSNKSVIENAFWEELDRVGATTAAGVPMTFSMLRRLGFEARAGSTLRTLIQAGGRLDEQQVLHFHHVMQQRSGRFFVMYGQTEASPRMTVLPSDWIPNKLGSVGPAVPRGRLLIENDDGAPLPSGQSGRVVFEGPNVMMGYAESEADLLLGDVCGGRLDTGDEGYLDDDGCLFLTGRTKRICKLSGVRVSLDEVEAMVTKLMTSQGQVAAYSPEDDVLILVFEGISHEIAVETARAAAKKLRVPPKFIQVRADKSLPRLSNGKTDYRALVEGGLSI